jgi:hypothetical protein
VGGTLIEIFEFGFFYDTYGVVPYRGKIILGSPVAPFVRGLVYRFGTEIFPKIFKNSGDGPPGG